MVNSDYIDISPLVNVSPKSIVSKSELPDGLHFCTGRFYGVMKGIVRNYTVTVEATYEDKICREVLAFSSYPNISDCDYNLNDSMFYVNQIIQPITLNCSYELSSVTVTPSLPEGLSISNKNGAISGKPVSISPSHLYSITIKSFKISKTLNVTIKVLSLEKSSRNRKLDNYKDIIEMVGIEMDIIEYSIQSVPTLKEFEKYKIITSRVINTMEIYNNNSEINPLFNLPPSIFNLNQYHAIKFHGYILPQFYGNYEFRIIANDGYNLNFPDKKSGTISQRVKSGLTERKVMFRTDDNPLEFNLITTRFLNFNLFRFDYRFSTSKEYELISSRNCIIRMSNNITNAFYTKSNNIIIESNNNNANVILYPFYKGTVTNYYVMDSLPANIILNITTGILTISNPSTGKSMTQNIEVFFGNDFTFVKVTLRIIFLSNNHHIITNNSGILTKFYSIESQSEFRSDDITLSLSNMYSLKKSYISTINEMNNECNELSNIWINLPYDLSLPFIADWKSLFYFPLSWDYCFYMEISSTSLSSQMNDISFIFIDGVNITTRNINHNMACSYILKGYHLIDFHAVLYTYNRNIHFYINSTSVSLLNYGNKDKGIVNVEDYIIPYYEYNNYMNGFIIKEKEEIIYPNNNNEEIFYYKYRKYVGYKYIVLPVNVPIFNYDNINPIEYTVVSPNINILNSIGLYLDRQNGRISGIPTVDYYPETDIIITIISNEHINYNTTITLSIEQYELSDDDVEYNSYEVSVTLWKLIELIPTINETVVVDNFTIISGNLPNFLEINPLTGVISGIANEMVNNRDVTILISNHGSSIQKTIRFYINKDCKGDIDPIFFYFNFTRFRNQVLTIEGSVSGNIFSASGTNKEEDRIICQSTNETIRIFISRDDVRDNPFLSLNYYPDVHLFNGNVFNESTKEQHQFEITFPTFYDKPNFIDINNTVTFTVFDEIKFIPSIGPPYSLCRIDPNYLPNGLTFNNKSCEISGNSLYSTETNHHNIDYLMTLSNPHSSINKQFQLKIENCNNNDSELIELYIINNYNNYYKNGYKLMNIRILDYRREIIMEINDFKVYNNQNFITQYYCIKRDVYIVDLTFVNDRRNMNGIDLKESNSNIEIYITTFNGFLLFYFNSKYSFDIRPRSYDNLNEMIIIEDEMNMNRLIINYNSSIWYSDRFYDEWLEPKYNFKKTFVEKKIFSIPFYKYNNVQRYYKTEFNIDENMFYISSIVQLSVYYREGVIIYLNNNKIYIDSINQNQFGVNHEELYNMFYITFSILELNLLMNYINVEIHQSQENYVKDNNEDYFSLSLDIIDQKCFEYNSKIPFILSSNVERYDNINLYKLLQPLKSEDFVIIFNPKINFTLDIFLPNNYYIIINRYTVISSNFNDMLINIPISWRLYGINNSNNENDNINEVVLDEQNDVVFEGNYESKIFYLPPRSLSFNHFRIIFTKVGINDNKDDDVIQQSVLSLNSIVFEGCNIQYCIYEGHDPVEIGDTIRLNCPSDETGYIERKCLLNFETKKPYWSNPYNHCKVNPPKIFEIIPLESNGYTGYPIETLNLLCSGRNVGYNVTPSLPDGIKLIASQINGISQYEMNIFYNVSCCNDGGCLTKSFRINVKLAACANDNITKLHDNNNRNNIRIKLRKSYKDDGDDNDEDYWPTTMVGNTSVINCKSPLIGVKERSCYFDSYPVWGKVIDKCREPGDKDSDVGTIVGVIIGVLAVLVLIVGVICCLKSKRIKRQSLMINNSKSRTYSNTRRNNNGGINLSEFGFIQ